VEMYAFLTSKIRGVEWPASRFGPISFGSNSPMPFEQEVVCDTETVRRFGE
jgi:hypothetical protein